MNLTGVRADARKRLEAKPDPFSLRGPCIVCGSRELHAHAVARGNPREAKRA